MRSVVPRPHQDDAQVAVDTHYPEFKDQLIVAPTGSGKSITMVHVAEKHLAKYGGTALVLCPFTKINDQLYGAFDKVSDLRTGRLNETRHVFSLKDVYVGTIQSTLSEEYQKMAKGLIGKDVSIVFLDEAHIGDEWYEPLLDMLNDDCLVVRLTATPYKGNQWAFTDSKLVYSISLREMIDAGFLVKPTLVQVQWPDKDPVAIAKEITKIYLEKHKGEKAVVYWRSIEEAKEATAIMKGVGINANFIASTGLTDDVIDKRMDDFINGDLAVMHNVNMLSVGFDFPALALGFMPFPQRSVNYYIQRIGRIIRSHPLKDKATMYLVGDAPSIKEGIYEKYINRALDEKAERPEGCFQELLDLENKEELTVKDTAKLKFTRELCDAINEIKAKGGTSIAALLTGKKFPPRFLKDVKWIAERFEHQGKAGIQQPIDPICKAYLNSQGFDDSYTSQLNHQDSTQLMRVVQEHGSSRHGAMTIKEGKYKGRHPSELPPLYIKSLYQKFPKSQALKVYKVWKRKQEAMKKSTGVR
jgi:superfamily II DNA or RNA helicase